MILINIVIIAVVITILREINPLLFNDNNANPDRIKQIAAFAIMGLHDGVMLMKAGTWYSQPINTTKLTVIKAILILFTKIGHLLTKLICLVSIPSIPCGIHVPPLPRL
jgi:hypothetical protein